MMASKKGISAHQLHRTLGVTYKAAWFICHRLRYAMASETVKTKLRGIVEVDETYAAARARTGPERNGSARVRLERPVIALVKRGGDVRTFRIRSASAANLKNAILENVDKRSKIVTDRWHAYMASESGPWRTPYGQSLGVSIRPAWKHSHQYG